jgi:POT family proton-dependent oligopeptide transporter
MYTNVDLATPLMWAGLSMLIIGNGFFKPNISSMIGQMYSDGDKRKDAAYTIFYMGINLGAFIAPLWCGTFGDTGNPADFKWGFLSAGVGMILGTILFHTQKDKYVITPDGSPIGALPNSAVEAATKTDSTGGGLGPAQLMLGGGIFLVSFLGLWKGLSFDVIGASIYAAIISMMIMIITDKSLSKVERDRIIVLFVSAFFVVFFWAAFEQAGASLTFFAEEQTNRNLLGWTIPTSFFQSVNAVAVVLLAPVTAVIWVALAKRKSEPSSLLKQALGLIILALGYVVIAIGVKGLGLGMKVSMFWLIALYVIHTIGELCLSPIGLSLVSKLSPIRFVSLLFGVWFLANAVANKAAGQLSGLYPPAGAEYKLALDNGFDERTYTGILDGSIQATPEQVSIAKAKEIPIKFPTFLGNPIRNLYEFFMVFVGMAGLAGLILVGLSFPMRKMMHGAD